MRQRVIALIVGALMVIGGIALSNPASASNGKYPETKAGMEKLLNDQKDMLNEWLNWVPILTDKAKPKLGIDQPDACLGQPADAERFFHCPGGNIFAGYKYTLSLYKKSGDKGVLMALAHEAGHGLQSNLDTPTDEHRADCLAGSFLGYAESKGWIMHPRDDADLKGFENFFPEAADAHGEGRINRHLAVLDGVGKDGTACLTSNVRPEPSAQKKGANPPAEQKQKVDPPKQEEQKQEQKAPDASPPVKTGVCVYISPENPGCGSDGKPAEPKKEEKPKAPDPGSEYMKCGVQYGTCDNPEDSQGNPVPKAPGGGAAPSD